MVFCDIMKLMLLHYGIVALYKSVYYYYYYYFNPQWEFPWEGKINVNLNKKAQLSLTNPRDACEKFAWFT